MKVKKVLSYILVAAMMLSFFALPATALEENETIVHYYNENNWQNPYIYYYSDGNTPVSWPGTAMNNDGDNWYSYTISNFSSAKVIFSNNGADQYPAQNQEGLTVSGEKWYKSGVFYDQNPDLSKITVHYYNTNAWNNPYIYYYADSSQPVIWPGRAMTSDGNGWYSYDIYGFDEAKVIFSDNGANQIPPQNETGYTVTGEKWFINGTLYDAEPDGITVHFYDYNNWGNVNIYYYSGNLEGTSWAGVPMNADGDGWYTYKIYGYNEVRVLFNNGRGAQIPGVMEEGFPVSGEMWYRNGTWTTERPDEITVYFYKPDGWNSPNIYYYLNDSDTGAAWPGTAMTEVSDGWYGYTITKYASAKVLFNSGTNQIPAQNQPGLDASGVMWYKNGVWCNSESDTDSDKLPDYMELIYNTNINNADTDGDGLPDGFEVITLGTDPLKPDSDNNGINDGQEDADSDALNNLREYQLGTDPNKADTDDDGLTDSEEVNTYNTNPLEKDTDGDTLSDSDDVALGFSPLLQDTDGDGTLDCDEKIEQTMSQSIEDEEKPEVTDVTVSFSGTGNINNTTTIENIYNVDILSSEVVGLVGVPVEIKTTSQFDEAVITFTYDDTQLGDTPEENLSVMWYDEENNWFQILDRESVVDTENNTVSVTTTHFSKYMLVDKEKWFNKWETELSYTRDNNQSYHFSFVVDVSGSMQGSSLASAKEALNQFADSFTEQDTKSLVAFNHTAVAVSNIWDTVDDFKTAVSNLQAGGGTSVHAGLLKGIELVDGRDSSMPKIIILLCDGDVDDCSNLVDYCVEKSIKIFAVNVVTADSAALKNMAQKTGGGYYIASTDSELSNIMNRINNEIDPTDTDSDGLPDVFEEQGMLLINGQIYKTNPSKYDSDNDGVSDGVEMGIPEGEDFKDYILAKSLYIGRSKYRYCVCFKPISNPRKPDSDGDGMLDGKCKYKAGKVVLPADDKAMEKHPMSDVLKMQYDSINDSSLSTYYTEQPKFDLNVTADTVINGVNDILAKYNGELIPGREVIARNLIDTILSNRDTLQNLYPMLTIVVKSIKAIDGIIWSNETAAWISAEVGAYILNFCRVNNSGTTFHARPDTWQKDYGYNVFYDDVFEIGSYMRIGKNYFEYDDDSNGTDEEYIIWAWRGDYWNLGAGCEVGIYKYDRTAGNEDHYNASPFNLPMSLNMYELPENGSGSIQPAFHWYPNDSQWWITGFDYSRQSPDPSKLVTVGYIDLSENADIYKQIKTSKNLRKNINLMESQKLYHNFIFDSQNNYIWFVWSD